jgi:hypothetical protein
MSGKETLYCEARLVEIKQEAAHKLPFKPVCPTAPHISIVKVCFSLLPAFEFSSDGYCRYESRVVLPTPFSEPIIPLGQAQCVPTHSSLT